MVLLSSAPVTVDVRGSNPPSVDDTETMKHSQQKPSVEINTKKHLSPSLSNWQLVGRCRAYNSHNIQKCQWKQVYPRPTSAENTVLPGGTKDCLSTPTPSHNIDATLGNLKVPSYLGRYTFELSCTDDNENTGADIVEILVNELIRPIITVGQQNLLIPTSIDNIQLKASCEAVQGEIVKHEWVYIDGPNNTDPTAPSDDGILQRLQPGTYKFKYQCTDSYGLDRQRYKFNLHFFCRFPPW